MAGQQPGPSPFEGRPAVYYIAPDGSDANPGTSTSAPWKTLSKVNSVTFLPGDRILFKSGGVWNGTLQPRGSGTMKAKIVIDKYDGDTKPVIHGGGKTNGSSTLLLDKVSYWEVNNLEITNTVPDGLIYAATGIRVNGGSRSDSFCTNIRIKNCYVHDVNAATALQANYVKGTGGIILNGKLSDVWIQDCHIANCSVEGLRTTGFSDMEQRSKNIVFDNNLIENIYGDGIVMAQVSGGARVTNNTVYNACMTNDINFAGIWTVASTNTIVSRNEVYGMKGGGRNDGMAFDADGWDGPSATEGDVFEYNYSHDNNGGFFLFMSQANHITVRYNVSVNDVGKTGAKKLFLIQDSPNKDRFVYNNIFVLKNPVDKLFWEGSGAVFSNNIFYTTSTIAMLADKLPDARAHFNNNCFYPETVFAALNWGEAVRNSNFFEDPLLVNPLPGSGLETARGYTISAASPCRNAGMIIKNNGGADFLGTALPAGKPDVGAFQYIISGAGSSLKKAVNRR
ncbi:right-handed parallel beta-helix repeat-containing protein [Niabella pedocola]|uniref:Right-handed parallel beta-helix repeat-containing protein n=1 Tax=Niabella pedocola TaxID=1752077 RepID=A0ABS8PLA9_9BACT|nr:right-handed parallel beta-helix repeat-containing protein [Niabella pedocola]MCD2421889.1 right-handed parallel beta-helix repeat-containing protein [Niabella pedocola]